MLYDCFTFFNELELLELRLELLNNVVDFFVLVESNKTFTNSDKEFVFEKNRDRFSNYLNKIIYIKVEDMPNSNDAWELEFHQRNCISKGLTNCKEDDLVIISDIDEIPNPKVLNLLGMNQARVNFFFYNKFEKKLKQVILFPRSIFRKQYGFDILEKTPLSFEQSMYYYFVNCQSKKTWNGSIICRVDNVTSPQALRNLRNRLPRLGNGGWHFSYLGGIDRIITKINSYAETQTNTPKTNSIDYIRYCINNGIDLFERKGEQFEYQFVEIGESYPANIHSWIKKYPYLSLEKN